MNIQIRLTPYPSAQARQRQSGKGAAQCGWFLALRFLTPSFLDNSSARLSGNISNASESIDDWDYFFLIRVYIKVLKKEIHHHSIVKVVFPVSH